MFVVLRADAGLKIGAGHVMRCLALANTLAEKGATCCFIMRRGPGDLEAHIRASGHQLCMLPEVKGGQGMALEDHSNHSSWLHGGWKLDANECEGLLADFSCDWLIVDHYGIDLHWEKQLLSSVTVKKLMVIDDLADRKHCASVLLDQNLGRQVQDYEGLLPSRSQRLIGPGYALLRPEFREFREVSLKRRKDGYLNSILITMGGMDKDNVTARVLKVLQKARLPFDCSIKVVMGQRSPWIDDIRSVASQTDVSVEVLVGVSNMAEEMSNVDLAIGAAGGTAWERCCLGVPTLLVTMAANQIAGAMALDKSGAAILLGGPEQMEAPLMAALEHLSVPCNLCKMSDTAARICDGWGADRVAEQLLVGES